MCVERLHHHARAEVGAADADIDDVGEAAPGADAAITTDITRHFTHAVGVGQHCIEHRLHLGAEEAAAGWRAQRGVQHGAAFGAVDRCAAEHRVALRFEAAFARQVDEEPQRRGVDPVLRQVGKNLWHLHRERRKAAGIAREGFAQVEVPAMSFKVATQCGPGRGLVAAQVVTHFRPSIKRSSLAASAANPRMPSASFSVAIASWLSA